VNFNVECIEYEKASQNLGNNGSEDWWEQFDKRPSPYFDVVCEIVGDLPMVCLILGCCLEVRYAYDVCMPDLLCHYRHYKPNKIFRRFGRRPSAFVNESQIFNTDDSVYDEILPTARQ
jgi:hypothetical protein